MSAPFMQLYVADYLGDTQHLTTEQHGAYLLLLMTMWRQGGSLPTDERTLARVARISPRRWHLIAPEVMAFFDVAEGRVTQKRLVEEYQKAVSKSEKRSAIGKLGGEAKALKDKESSLAKATHLPRHSSEPEPDREDTNASSLKRAQAQSAIEFADKFWPAYPNKTGKPKALTSFITARKSASLEEIMAGLTRYIASKPPDRQWLNPTTFLNQQRWADEPAQITGGQHEQRHSNSARPSFIDGARKGIRSALAGRRVHGPVEPHDQGSGADWSDDEHSSGMAARTFTFEPGEGGSYEDREQHPRRYANARH